MALEARTVNGRGRQERHDIFDFITFLMPDGTPDLCAGIRYPMVAEDL